MNTRKLLGVSLALLATIIALTLQGCTKGEAKATPPNQTVESYANVQAAYDRIQANIRAGKRVHLIAATDDGVLVVFIDPSPSEVPDS